MIEIEGLADLRKELRAAVDATPRELTKALRGGAEKLKVRMVALQGAQRGEHSEGRLAGSFRVYSQARSGGVRSALPQAGVFEFARQYKRRSRSGSTHTVTFHDLGPTPRFGYRALDELAEELVKDAETALVDLAKLHGWFVEA